MFGISTKDDTFFQAFKDHAQKSLEGARALEEMFENMDRKAELAADVKKAENAADTITHDTLKALHETWITPIDRDDIHTLITTMDDVLDAIHAVSDRVVVFEIEASRDEAKELAKVLVQCCEKMKEAMDLLPGLKKPQEILTLCREIDRLESEADAIFRRALGNIYRTRGGADGGPYRDAMNPVEILKWRDLFDNLEGATDRANDVANILEGIVLEYA